MMHSPNVAPMDQPDAPAAASPVRPGLIFRVCGRPGQNDRPPLPAGHPVSWGLLTDNTTLEGSAYPYPVFLD